MVDRNSSSILLSTKILDRCSPNPNPNPCYVIDPMFAVKVQWHFVWFPPPFWMTSSSPYTIYTMSLEDTKHGTIIIFVARNSTVSDFRGYPRYTNNDRYTCAYRIIWLVIQYCSFVFHNSISACVHATAVINPIHIRTALLVFVGISCCTLNLSCVLFKIVHI